MVQAVGRALRVSGCYNCRLSLLRAFGLVSEAPLFTTPQLSKVLYHPIKEKRRAFSNFPRDLSIPVSVAEEKGAHIAENGLEEKVSNAEPSDSPPVPWYLQIEPSLKPPRPLSVLQQIPDLPKSPPPILEPLLQKISVDLGIDDLSLLDLRHLYPPPALGADLLMIIGTARSEKHLHVSADRLCRWLRSDYKLRPDADGLLGRNELKLKLRRKNRRAKLLGSGISRDDEDDGVRTGWVCVNIGAVESGTALVEEEANQEEFIGFGRQAEGIKIVVQLLVEEKREELDLERLWSGLAKRGLRDGSEVTEESTTTTIWQASSVPDTVAASSVKAHGSTTIPSSITYTANQARSFHTGLGRISSLSDRVPTGKKSTVRMFSTHSQSDEVDLASIKHQVLVQLESGELKPASSLLRAQDALHMTMIQDVHWRKRVLDQLKVYIETIPQEKALQIIGNGYEDRNSTPFIYCFYRMISRYPSEWEWEYMIWLYSFARKLQHADYSLGGLSRIFNKLRSSGVTISDNMYLGLLRSTLRPYEYSRDDEPHQADDGKLQFVIKILWDMHDRTGSILTEDMFVMLQESLAYRKGRLPIFPETLRVARNAALETYNLPVHVRQYHSDKNNRLTQLMTILQVRVTEDINRIRLMTIYAKEYHWVYFWEFWRSMARHGESRSPALWALMFRLVAETKHQYGCMTVLRAWIPEMDREDPQVKLEGEVLESVQACLTIADPVPDLERLSDAEAKGEWIPLWRRCLGKM